MESLTPDGVAGVAVVRVAPGERARVLALLASPAAAAFAPRVGAPMRATMRLDGQALDDVLVVDRAGSGLELHLHGSRAVLHALDRRFGLRPSPCAHPAAALLRRALGDEQLDLALEQLAFEFDHELRRLGALPIAERAAARSAALVRSQAALALVAAPRVVLFGQQNAGKSSLFNRLLCRERALTGPLPGLTRDPVADVTALSGYPYELVDTAGEGPTPEPVDHAAVMSGREARDGAIRVLVIDGNRGPDAVDELLVASASLVVAAKADLPRGRWPADVPYHLEVSTTTGDIASLRREFGELLRTHRGLPAAGPVGGFAALDEAQLARLLALPG